VLEKVGGDTMDDVRTNLDAYRARIARPLEMPIAGGAPATEVATAAAVHGLAGTDQAGSGGDD
jgi:hypothetical protein